MSKISTSKLAFIKVIVLAGLLVLVGSVFAYWRLVYSNPTTVFKRMLANSLSSTSVSKIISQDDESQKLDQVISLQAQPEQQVHTASIITQAFDADTTISNESIGTLKTDFVRYTNIKSSQKNAQNKPYDFSSILNIWGRSDQDDPNGNGAELFNQNVLGVMPLANVPQPLRSQLIKKILKDDVYKFDKNKVQRKLVNDRPVYTYEVTVQPVPYVTMLKAFAHAIGLRQLEQVDPTQYQGSSPLNFTFEIDVWSGQLSKITYKNSPRTEIYKSYGARNQVVLPTNSIPVNELQTRLQQIQ